MTLSPMDRRSVVRQIEAGEWHTIFWRDSRGTTVYRTTGLVTHVCADDVIFADPGFTTTHPKGVARNFVFHSGDDVVLAIE